MRIIHVTPKFRPDVGYQENYLPSHQRDLGHEVKLVTSSVPSDAIHTNTPVDAPGTYEYGGIETFRLESWFDIADGGIVVMRGLERLLRQLDPDIIHVHTLFNTSTLRAVRYASTADVPVFVDVHVDNDNIHLDRLYKKIGFKIGSDLLSEYVVPRAESIFPVNPQAQRFLRTELEVPESQIEFLPLGVDREAFSPDAAAGQMLRNRYGIARDKLLVLTVGNLGPTKDIEVLLEAFADVSETTEESRLVIVGDGPTDYVEQLQQAVEDLGLKDQVLFTGTVPHDELPAFFNAADVGVWPGKLGISAVEAIGTGLPIVVCESRATEFLVSNGNGRTFARGDVDSLAEELEAYLHDEKRRERHGRNAARFATETLAWDQIARKSLDAYRSAL